jgi:hypothetical protein
MTADAARAGRITSFMPCVLGYSLLEAVLLTPVAAILSVNLS